jgi:hypothetical protein
MTHVEQFPALGSQENFNVWQQAYTIGLGEDPLHKRIRNSDDGPSDVEKRYIPSPRLILGIDANNLGYSYCCKTHIHGGSERYTQTGDTSVTFPVGLGQAWRGLAIAGVGL